MLEQVTEYQSSTESPIEQQAPHWTNFGEMNWERHSVSELQARGRGFNSAPTRRPRTLVELQPNYVRTNSPMRRSDAFYRNQPNCLYTANRVWRVGKRRCRA